jgi:Multiubiquitin
MNKVLIHLTTMTVNERPVEIDGPRVTGLAIKEAAIAAGLPIGLDFLLTEEEANGRAKVIGDTDVVTVNKNSRFDAVAGDDNS